MSTPKNFELGQVTYHIRRDSYSIDEIKKKTFSVIRKQSK